MGVGWKPGPPRGALVGSVLISAYWGLVLRIFLFYLQMQYNFYQ